MKRNNLKQIDLARKLNISRQAVNKWFTKGYSPEIEHMPKLAELFGVTVDELLGTTMVDNVNLRDTGQPTAGSTFSAQEMLKAQQRITELQEQLLKYQARDLEEKERQLEQQQKEIDRQRQLSPPQDAT